VATEFPFAACACTAKTHAPQLVVLTGGPGAGKTAVLEVVRRHLCAHVKVLPEAATILWTGGFPRRRDPPARRAAQRAIVHVQRELEQIVLDDPSVALALCDRGTIDGEAYWPGDRDDLWGQLGTSRAQEMKCYAAVIHLRTPSRELGYNHTNPARTESAAQAAEIDARLVHAWEGHPHRFFIDSQTDFLEKLRLAIERIRAELPECCRPPSA
jgi:predicted ATPase